MADIQVVVFDLDDTLYSERSYALSGLDAVAVACEDVLGDRVASAARMKALFDSDLCRRIFNEILLERRLPDDPKTVARMIEAYRNHQPTISLHVDADVVLTHLRSSYRLGIITDGPAVMQRAKLKALGLAGLVDEIIVTDELGQGCSKPSVVAFELVAKRFGVEHQRCVYVGDNPSKDFVAPNQLGWLSVQIIRSDGIYRNAVAPVDGEPVHVLDTLDDLKNVLTSTAS